MALDAARLAEVQAREAQMIRDTASWPCDPIHVKTAVWVDGIRRFGFLRSTDLTTVILKDGDGRPGSKTETFASVEDLARIWMGD